MVTKAEKKARKEARRLAKEEEEKKKRDAEKSQPLGLAVDGKETEPHKDTSNDKTTPDGSKKDQKFEEEAGKVAVTSAEKKQPATEDVVVVAPSTQNPAIDKEPVLGGPTLPESPLEPGPHLEEGPKHPPIVTAGSIINDSLHDQSSSKAKHRPNQQQRKKKRLMKLAQLKKVAYPD